MFGRDLGYLKGRTTRRKPLPILSDTVEIPKELYQKQQDIVLCIDGMNVNAMHFLTTISKNIMYRTAQYMQQNRAKNVFGALDVVLRLYNSAGFRIAEIHCDREFEPIFNDLKDEWDVTMVCTCNKGGTPRYSTS